MIKLSVSLFSLVLLSLQETFNSEHVYEAEGHCCTSGESADSHPQYLSAFPSIVATNTSKA